ncbi:MAG: substrate-binding domain-containing protein [Clostridiales bacterium]|nr:substrate-binding domain-containing protein [Clostridiales bacterium]
MKRKRIGILALICICVLVLAGCGTGTGSLAKVDGLDALGSVQVISREEGSGTRSAFAQLLGFDTSSGESQSDATAEDALIAEDAQAVIDAVSADEAAIGYISMGALDSSESIKALSVDGVEATLQNTADGKYALSRPFILAWSGSLSELEQDYLTYVMGKGQAIVNQSYVAVTESTTFLSGQYEGTITVSGSTSVVPLLEELAEEYMSINTHAVVEVSATDSTTGLNDAMQGSCDLAMSSRELEDYEKELLSYKTIARDGIAVIVNTENPITEVTTAELKSLFTGEYTQWDDINIGRS